ncbi:MAG: hypothetical protein SFY96_06180 [Planctomycetota bacterium]|nr:hypothetical protein [Planctomycetota bacterium]
MIVVALLAFAVAKALENARTPSSQVSATIANTTPAAIELFVATSLTGEPVRSYTIPPGKEASVLLFRCHSQHMIPSVVVSVFYVDSAGVIQSATFSHADATSGPVRIDLGVPGGTGPGVQWSQPGIQVAVPVTPPPSSDGQ